MKPHSPQLRPGASCALVCLALALTLFAAAPAFARGDKDWKPVDPSDLATPAPVVEKDADAEVLFWDVRVSYEESGGQPVTVLSHYVRIKVFNERGRDAVSKVEIPAIKYRGREVKIGDVAARTVKPGGEVVELKKEDVFDRDLVKASGLKFKAKTFAMPAVEPGAVVEYRWREVRNGIFPYERFDFARDMPVRSVTYHIRAYKDDLVDSSGRRVGLRAQLFQTDSSAPFTRDKEGFYNLTLVNVPAFHEEPHMPPEYSVRPWMLLYYSPDQKQEPASFWREYGKHVYESSRSEMKAGDEVKAKAAELTAGARTDEEKVARLFDFCHSQLKNLYDDANGMTAAEREKAKENKSPADTLKRGVGTGRDIDMLFAALATASGFEARLANLGDRGDTFFDPGFADDYFIRTYDIALKVGGEWRFYDPAAKYLPFGMLRWQEEGQQALLSDPKEPTFVITQNSGPEKSREKRTGKFKLSEDGTLEGDVTLEYTGHFAADLKELNDGDTPAEREEALKNRYKERLGGAELTEIKVENSDDPVKPFVQRFHVRVPGYASRTGKRLFLQPAFFQKGLGPIFPTAGRRQSVYFHYAWSEEDYVEIDLPEGFALDNAEGPASFSADKLSKYEPSAGITQDGRTLVYKRKFYFGVGGGRPMLYPVSTYPALKEYFDGINKQDAHTIALKQGAAAAK